MLRSTACAGIAALTLALATPASADYVGGTDEGERLDGTDGSDFIQGFGGNDELYGRAGFDDLRGGDGNDHLWLNRGALGAAEGGDGDDVIHGAPGNSYMAGELGDDKLFGGQGNRKIPFATFDYGRGYEGDDVIRLADGPDAGEPDAGEDIVRLGGGPDFVYLTIDPVGQGDQTAGSIDRIFCGFGDDVVEYVGPRDPADVLVGCEQIDVRVSRQEFEAKIPHSAGRLLERFSPGR
jgi:Ca2+-binding RTX toxin-like protein